MRVEGIGRVFGGPPISFLEGFQDWITLVGRS